MLGNDAYYTLFAFQEMCTRNCSDGKVAINEEKPKLSLRDLAPEDLNKAKQELQKASEEKRKEPKTEAKKTELGDFSVLQLTSGSSQKRYTGKTRKQKLSNQNGSKETKPTKERDLISFDEMHFSGLVEVESSDVVVFPKQRDVKRTSSKGRNQPRRSRRYGWTKTDDMNLLKEKSIIDDLDAAFTSQAISNGS